MTLIRSWIGLQPGRFDAGDGAHFVLVGGVAGNAAGADDVAVGIADQHAARIADHAAAARRRQHGEELRRLRRTARQGGRAETHAERAPGFAEGDVETQDAGFVLALERDQMAAVIEHRDGERSQIVVAAFLQRDIDDGGSLRKRDHDEYSGSAGDVGRYRGDDYKQRAAANIRPVIICLWSCRGWPNRPRRWKFPRRPSGGAWPPGSRRACARRAAGRCRAPAPRPASTAYP